MVYNLDFDRVDEMSRKISCKHASVDEVVANVECLIANNYAFLALTQMVQRLKEKSHDTKRIAVDHAARFYLTHPHRTCQNCGH